jgi:hypothetical protein
MVRNSRVQRRSVKATEEDVELQDVDVDAKVTTTTETETITDLAGCRGELLIQMRDIIHLRVLALKL